MLKPCEESGSETAAAGETTDSRGAGPRSNTAWRLAPPLAGRCAQQAVVEVEELVFRGHPDVVDADLADYFGSIPHADLLKSVARRIVDRRVLHLIKMWHLGFYYKYIKYLTHGIQNLWCSCRILGW
jgi:hypothetical protein